MLLAIVFFVCSIAFPQPIFSVVKSQPQNLALIDRQIYEKKLTGNDGTGELREFIQKLEDQNETMAKLIEKCEATEERKDAKLAQIYFSLRTKLGEIKRGEESVCDIATVERLRKSAVEAVFLLAKRMEIQREQIEDKANENKNENKIEILKKLAKNWDQNNWKRNGNEKNEKENSKNSENSYQNQRETLKMILAAIGDGNNGTMEILAKNSNSDGSSRRRRRKKRATTNMTTAFVVAIIIILALLSYFLVRPMVLTACQDGPTSSASTGASSSSTARGSARTSGGGSSSSISSMTSSTRSSNTSARTGASSVSSSSRASAGGTGNNAPTYHYNEDSWSNWNYWFPK
ncbi:hypothetical protein niasHT_006244 [Heterodera trifolii]|uniref:Effector protein n=1 Tax=Heterodera trifolii TaxID=157864 RepID=A0ABD2M1P7_9BILA